MTDTPVTPRDVPPVHASELIKAFIGDLARPFALYATGGGTAAATVIGAMKCEDGTQASLVIGAAGLILGGMYGVKEWGTTRQRVAETNANATGTPTT
jgi:hypothetical protein